MQRELNACSKIASQARQASQAKANQPAKQKEVAEIKTDWSRAQKDLMESKLALTDPEADKLAREQ